MQWSWVEASAGATNWSGSARQTTGYSDARAHGGGWAFSEPTPQLTVTGSRADSSEPSSTETSAQHNQTQHNQISWLGHWLCTRRPLCAESPQLYRASDHRINGPAKPVGRRQIPHFANPYLLQLLGFEEMILLRTGGLAASPPVRYTLETAEQCRGEARGPRGPALACGPSSRHRRFRRLLGLAARHRASGRLDVAPSIF